MREELPNPMPKKAVYKIIAVLILVTVFSWVSSVLLAPDGSMPGLFQKDKTVDYYNPGYSFQHKQSSILVPDYPNSSPLTPAKIPSHIALFRYVDEEKGGGIVEVHAVAVNEGQEESASQSGLPVDFAFGPVATTPAMWKNIPATSYETTTKKDGRMVLVKGLWAQTVYKGEPILFDIRMTVFGPSDIDKTLVEAYTEEYERVLASFAVHNPPSQ